jgi:CubicO group peptidase (beta-lactamase class C family)
MARIALIAAALCCTGFAQAGTPASMTADDVRLFADQAIGSQMQRDKLPGMAIAVVKDGQLLFAKGYGHADIASYRLVDPATTMFRVASISKLLTASAILQQVERGNLDLQADISSYVDLKLPLAFPGVVNLHAIMTHSAGFDEGAFGMSTADPAQRTSLRDTLALTMPRQVMAPGRASSYSNHAVALGGYAVERVAGMPFARYIEKEILAPLQMTHSSFDEVLPPALRDTVATGYALDNGRLVAMPAQYVGGLAPAASLRASATDMARFMLMQLNQGRAGNVQVLSPDSVRQMQAMNFRNAADAPSEMGYGFARYRSNGLQVLTHGGDLRDHRAELLLLPEKNVGIFLACNSGDCNGLGELLQQFLDRYYPAPPAGPPATLTDKAQQYAGAYRLQRSVHGNFLKSMWVALEYDVKALDANTLTFDGARFRHAGKGSFKQAGATQSGLRGGDLVFDVDDDGVARILFSHNPFVYARKLDWYETRAFTLGVLVLSLAYLAAAVVLRRRSAVPGVRAVFGLVAASIGLLWLSWGALIAYVLATGILDTGFGVKVPLPVTAILTLPLLALALAAASLVPLAKLLRDRRSSLRDQLAMLAALPVMALLVFVFAYWRLLGLPHIS